MNINSTLNFYPSIKTKDIIKYFIFCVLFYCITFGISYYGSTRIAILRLLLIILILYLTKLRKILLVILFNVFFLVSLVAAGSSLHRFPIFLIDKIIVSSDWVSTSVTALRYELLPLFIFSVLFIQLIMNRKRLDEPLNLILGLNILFITLCIVSTLVLGTSKYELFNFIMKFTLMFNIILFISTLNLSKKDTQFFFKYVIFTITFLQILVIFIGWVIPTLQGFFISPDHWGGTEGRGSLRFVNLVSIGSLYFFTKLLFNKLKGWTDKVLLVLMFILILVTGSVITLPIYIITLVITFFLYLKQSKTRKIFKLISVLLIFSFFLFLISYLPTKFEMFKFVKEVTAKRIPMVLEHGFLNNPRVTAILDIFNVYSTDPSAIFIGVGPGMHFSGASAQVAYQGRREEITGGATTKVFALNNIFTEIGILGGIIFYLIFYHLFKIFFHNYLRYSHKLSLLGTSILTFIIISSFIKESFENPSLGLVAGVILGLIYKDYQINRKLSQDSVLNENIINN